MTTEVNQQASQEKADVEPNGGSEKWTVEEALKAFNIKYLRKKKKKKTVTTNIKKTSLDSLNGGDRIKKEIRL